MALFGFRLHFAREQYQETHNFKDTVEATCFRNALEIFLERHRYWRSETMPDNDYSAQFLDGDHKKALIQYHGPFYGSAQGVNNGSIEAFLLGIDADEILSDDTNDPFKESHRPPSPFATTPGPDYIQAGPARGYATNPIGEQEFIGYGEYTAGDRVRLPTWTIRY